MATEAKVVWRISDLSPDASLLRKRLESVAVGETVPYTVLSEVIGRDIRERRSALMRARIILMREKGFVFIPVRKLGIQRLGDEQIARLGESYVRRINKVALRGIRTLACVQNFDGLTEAAQISHNTGMSVLAFYRESSKRAAYAKVEEKVKAGNKLLPTAKLLELFR